MKTKLTEHDPDVAYDLITAHERVEATGQRECHHKHADEVTTEGSLSLEQVNALLKRKEPRN